MTRCLLPPALLAAALLVTAAATSFAQVTRPDSARADTTRPFVPGGMYDKPFQSRLLGRTAIGGYAEAHARYERVDGVRERAGFEAKRFNLFTATTVSDFVRLGAELEFEEGGHEIKVEYAAIDLRFSRALALRGGMLLSPLGRFNLSHDSPLNEFTDRPLVSTDLLGVALSEPGFGVLGSFSLGRSARATYELYATNGFNSGLIDNSPEGTRIPLGRGNFDDENGSPALVGRLTFSPSHLHELGVSMHRGAYNVFSSGGTDIDERRDLLITVLDAETALAGIDVRGEAAFATIDVPESLEGIYAARQRGFFAEAVRPFGRGWVRTMPTSAFAVKVRADYVDFDTQLVGQSMAQVTGGVNFRPTDDSVLKLDFVRGRGRDRFNNLAEHAFLLFSIASYF
ncbi:MAG TPA: hypothetical protein VFO55_07340 [Gemmatimonadaceae bacterium]|nr:hypothetical protein [Gemmatimonadaceae bacterium]